MMKCIADVLPLKNIYIFKAVSISGNPLMQFNIYEGKIVHVSVIYYVYGFQGMITIKIYKINLIVP